MWRIRCLLEWLWEYITLTPKKHYDVVYKLECLLCHATGGRYSKANYYLNDMYSMVNDYIDRCCDEAAAEAEEACRAETEEDFKDRLESAPTVDAVPVVHGRWVNAAGGRTICNNCGDYPLYDYFGRQKFSAHCPNCGAKMDLEVE